jgi:outer membrane protein
MMRSDLARLPRASSRRGAVPQWIRGPLLLMIVPLASQVARAQAIVAPSRALTPVEAAAAAITRHAAIRDLRAQLAQSEGVLSATGAPFENSLRLAASGGQDFTLSTTGAGGSDIAAARTARGGYAFTGARLFRSGIVLAPTVAVTRSELSLLPGQATGSALVSLSAVVPFWKDRGGRVSRAPERSARRAMAGTEASAWHTVALVAADALNAYWSCVAADARLSVYRANEQRAERIVADTRSLVAGDERTRADLNQAEANLAAKRVARLIAEQTVLESRQQLGVAMGLAPGEYIPLSQTFEDFPDTVALASLPDNRALDALARASRGDLRAARENEASARAQLDGTRDDLRPRLDAVVTVGYSGLVQGVGAPALFQPLLQHVPGANTSVQLRYELPVANQGARGRFMQATGLVEQQRAIREDVERRIQLAIPVAAEAVRSAHAVRSEADVASSLARRAVDSELRKFRLGVSTVFDVVLSQDALTNAELTSITARRTYIGAIVGLRMQTGTLVIGAVQNATLSTHALTTFP